MVKLLNVVTKDVVKVNNVERIEGARDRFMARYPVTRRFLNAYPMLRLSDEHTEDGHNIVCIIDTLTWEVTGRTRAKRAGSSQDESHTTPQPAKEATRGQELPAKVEEPTHEEKRRESAQNEPTTAGCDDVQQLALLLSRMKGGSVDVNSVREIVREELSKQAPTQVEHIVKVGETAATKFEGFAHPQFDTLLTLVANDRAIRRSPWLYGEAGSGKSTMAAKVAESLGLPFYCVSAIQQKYELEGFANAAGELVETCFYKAWRYGGVVCFDEITATSAEVQIAFNNALANMVYNFPVVGMVEAHKDFHAIACDNTIGQGGDNTYNASFVLSASTLDRFCMLEVGYTEEFDLYMAQGDRELVKFAWDVREAIKRSGTRYLCSPRAIKAVKALQDAGMSTKEALQLGIFNAFDEQARRNIISDVMSNNAKQTKYHHAAETL